MPQTPIPPLIIDGHKFEFDHPPTPAEVQELTRRVAAMPKPAPGLGTDVASMGGSMIGPAVGAAAAGALLGPEAIPLGATAGRVIGSVAPYAYQYLRHGQVPTGLQAAGAALGALPGGATATRMLGTKLAERPTAVARTVEGIGEAARASENIAAKTAEVAGKAGEAAMDVARPMLPTIGRANYYEQAKGILENVHQAMATALPNQLELIKQAFVQHGADLSKMSRTEFVERLRTAPQELVGVLQSIHNIIGRPMTSPEVIHEMWAFDALHRSQGALEGAAKGARAVFRTIAGKNAMVDGRAFLQKWDALGDAGQAVFPPKVQQGFRTLAANIERWEKTIPQIREAAQGADVAKAGGKSAVSLSPFLAAIEQFATKHPLVSGGAGLGMAEMATRMGVPPGLAYAPVVGGLVYQGGKRFAAKMADRLFATEPGITMMNRMLGLMQRGMPNARIADVLYQEMVRAPDQTIRTFFPDVATSAQQQAPAAPARPSVAPPGLPQIAQGQR